MIFQMKDYYVDLVQDKDLSEIIEVYNSNKAFLFSHMDKEEITGEWLWQEIESMKKVNFDSCKIVEMNSGKIIGIIDFRIEKETYLSLLILHQGYKEKGIGKLIIQAFEEHAKSLKSEYMRIDVVTDYDDFVIDFWIRNGYEKLKDVELNWTGKVLPAVTMIKNL